MTVTPVADSSVGHRRATIHPLRVSAVEPLTDDSVVIEFEIPEELAGEYSFTHGQHVSLRCEAAGDDVRRSYSICSAAGSGRLRVAVKRLPGGVFSAYAFEQLKRARSAVEHSTRSRPPIAFGKVSLTSRAASRPRRLSGRGSRRRRGAGRRRRIRRLRHGRRDRKQREA